MTPVSEPTEWVNSLVPTKKNNGALRVCLDPCNLNEAVKRKHHSIPTPEEKQGLQCLLGMPKFLVQYIPNEASISAPLRQLLKKDVAWQWCPHHRAALQTLKSTLTQALVLRYYNHKQLLTRMRK